MKSEFGSFVNFLNNFANKSSEILTKKFRKKFNFESKKDGSFVTDIDKEIEELFRRKVKQVYPSHGIYGEEFGYSNKNSEYVWVIDPLDGTHSFISGKPLFGTLICLTFHRIPVIGLIDVPILKERWVGGKDLGVFFNKKRCLPIGGEKTLNQSIVSSTSTLMFKGIYENKIKKIYKKSKFPIFGTDCYAYGLLLSKKIDLIIENNMKPWDYLAQVALINELGGIISDWSGNELDISSKGQVIATSSKKCYEEAIKILSTKK